MDKGARNPGPSRLGGMKPRTGTGLEEKGEGRREMKMQNESPQSGPRDIHKKKKKEKRTEGGGQGKNDGEGGRKSHGGSK